MRFFVWNDPKAKAAEELKADRDRIVGGLEAITSALVSENKAQKNEISDAEREAALARDKARSTYHTGPRTAAFAW
jgi:hypothetical protein